MLTFNRALSVLGPLILFTSSVFADNHVLVLETAPDTWQLLTVPGVQVNDRDHILVDPSAASLARKPIHNSVYQRLKAIRISDAPAIVTSPQGGALTLWVVPSTFAAAVPAGYRLDNPATPDHLWNATWVSYISDPKRNKRQALSAARVFAIVPSKGHSADALADFVLTPELFFDEGPKSAGFRKRMSLLSAVMSTYPNHAAALRLSEYVYREMDTRYSGLEKHAAGYPELLESLEFVAVSERIRPEDDRHRKLRTALTGYKERIDRDEAALKALAAGRQSDSLVKLYGEFERFDDFFLEVRAARGTAYQASVAMHYEKALKAYEAGKLETAKDELKTVLRRSPAFEEAQSLNDHLHIASTVGTRREAQPSQIQKTSVRWSAPGGPQPATPVGGDLQMQRYLSFADELTLAHRFADAKSAIGKAIFLEPKSPGIRLSLAKLRAAESNPLGALSELDDFDSRAGAGADGERVRAAVSRELRVKQTGLKREIEDAIAKRRYDESLRLSVDGLATVDPGDSDFLYYAGISEAILRRKPAAVVHLGQFLENSESLAGDRAKRLMARRILALLDRPVSPPSLPEKSWFSAWSLDAASFYDPVSGIFQPRMAALRGSNGSSVVFSWADGRLESVNEDRTVSHAGANFVRVMTAGLVAANYGRSSATLEGPDSEHNGFYFHYEGKSPQVVRVTNTREVIDGGTQRLRIQAPQTINGLVVRQGRTNLRDVTPEVVQRDSSQGFLTLLNGPGIDPLIAEAFTGEPAAFGFAPNAYFHPFAWERIHLFALSYDDDGRIRSARDTGSFAQPLEFQWYGQRLERIVQHANSDQRSPLVYERTMHYAGDLLTAETIRFNGKTSRIDYRYDADRRLVEGISQSDDSVGRIARRALFNN